MKSEDLDRFSDRDLAAELRSFINGVTGSEASYGVTPAQTAAFTALLDGFDATLTEIDAARIAEDTALGKRDDERPVLNKKARQMFQIIRAQDGMNEENLGKANLDAYDKIKTDAPSPSGVPFLLVDFRKLRQEISFRDTATPNSDAKPKGMLGCEIYYFVGTEKPTSYDDYKFLTLDTATPYTAIFNPEDAGKTVWYIARWRSKNGETGEWSAVVEATING